MVGVLLSAGASTRMGAPKGLVRQGGDSFIAHGVRHLWVACNTVVTVLGAEAKRVRQGVEEEFTRLIRTGRLHQDFKAASRQGADGLEVHFVVNGKWREGMLSSVRVGLLSALELKPAGILVLPVDHPTVKPRTVGDLVAVMKLALEACRTGPERARFSYALVPRYRGRRGHPVVLSPALARAIAADRDAEDLSDAIRRSSRLVGYLDVTDPGVVRNQNTPKDAKRAAPRKKARAAKR